MRRIFIVTMFTIATAFTWMVARAAGETKTLEIGEPAPEFNLTGLTAAQAGGQTQIRNYTLQDFKDAQVLVVVFLANHCPVATAYEDRVMKLAADFKDKAVAVVAISPNAAQTPVTAVPMSDRGDSLEEMKIRAEKKGFNFPYLFDGNTQEVSRAFGPVATPHVFIFDKERKLRYVGRIDNSQDPAHVTSSEARDAIVALLAGKPVPVEKTKAFGCSIRWWSNDASVKTGAAAGGNGSVLAVNPIDGNRITQLVRNGDSGKLRLINVWATWCGPCREEMPDLAKLAQEFGPRGVDVVTISADQATARSQAQTFLTRQNLAGHHYIYSGTDMAQLIDAVDKEWQGAIPYTMLIAPSGKVVYRAMGKYDPKALREAIEKQLGK